MTEQINVTLIEEEMKEAYIDYAMSVITSRALPDVNDGLKPVHRKILYAMHKSKLIHNKPFRKSAFIIGRVLASYHPHGDIAVYDALVRMAQNFSLRYPLIEGQGNFGCFTGDTKIKLLDGTSKSFKELCESHKNKSFYVYSVDKKGEVVIGEASNPRVTKRKSRLIEVTLDTGEKIRCTPDHRFLLKNLKYKQAKDLNSNDSLMPGYFKLSKIKDSKDYLTIKQPKDNRFEFVHRISDKFNIINKIYNVSQGSVRHHIDFNKLNNDPTNIQRMSWEDHTLLHSKHIDTLWKDPEFREKQKRGAQNNSKNPVFLKKIRKILRTRNKDKQFIKKSIKTRKEKYYSNKEWLNKLSKTIKSHYEEHPERKEINSRLSKEMWRNPIERSKILKKLRKSMKNPKVRDNISKGVIKSNKLHPNIKYKRILSLKKYYKNPDVREKISKRSKLLWKDPNYRSKYDVNHFSNMAKNLWKDKDVREFHRNKAKEQWQNEDFRNNMISLSKKQGKLMHKNNPGHFKEMANEAAKSLTNLWKSDVYKSNVIKSRILKYVNTLLLKSGKITPGYYDNNRSNNCYPKYENAIKYFKNHRDLIQKAKSYNHRVIGIKYLKQKEDVYDITVKDYHNFLLDSEVFVHNSQDGHPAAASRYTEARLTKIAEELLEDLDKKTVKYIPNYDNSTTEPIVLPGKLPNLLLNGTTGIAVGMASNIPPHNIKEVVDAITTTIDNPEISTQEIMNYIKGPDFPTGGIIQGISGIRNAYTKGKGKLVVKSKVETQDKKLIITEIPYMVNKTTLIETMADLVRNKKVEGIRNIQDESDRKGMSIVVELKDNSNPEIVLNQLYKYSPLQTTIGITMIALVAGQPKIMSLKDIIDNYISHRKRVVTRRTQYELERAQARAHILEGLKKALKNIDAVVKTIKASKNVEVARKELMQQFTLSEKQAEAILEMRLQRLTSLETQKIDNEYQELLKKIKEYQEILASEEKIYEIIKIELNSLKEKYGDDRRTIIEEQDLEVYDDRDFIKKEDVVVTYTRSGYIKQTPLTEYKSQHRGGTGVTAAKIKEEDVIQQVFTTSNYNTLLFFTNLGRLYWHQAYQLPIAGRYGKGKAIVNLLKLKEDEHIQAILPLKKLNDEDYVLLATKQGLLKKTSVKEFSRPRPGGIKAIKLKEKDELVAARLSPGNLDFLLATKKGYAIKFNEKDVRTMGRVASGVRGIKLREDQVIGMEVARQDGTLLTVTSNGYGKRSKIENYRLIKRGGKGVINILTKHIKPTSKNENVVGVKTVMDNDEILFITKLGSVIRTKASGISIIGRNTQGVRLIRLKDNDKVVDVARINNNETKQDTAKEGSIKTDKSTIQGSQDTISKETKTGE